MSSVHAGDVLEYNAHSLYGLMESIETKNAVAAATGARPFVLTRSTFASSGHHVAHWTGDNEASWRDLAGSIITMNNLAMFGISMTGADICGFGGDTTEELCARWIEVGAFSTFVRDHNAIDSQPQELYRWESVTEASKSVLAMRYQLLPHLYTLMYLAHSTGITVHNALWTHFPSDANVFGRDGQFMWYDSILFTPVLTEGAREVTGYFPKAVWYSLFDDSVIDASAAGKVLTLPTPLTATNAHVRGGTVLPMQQAAMTTRESRKTPFKLMVAMDTDGSAQGSLFLDDGIQLSLDRYQLMNFVVSPTQLKSFVVDARGVSAGHKYGVNLGSVEIRGVSRAIDKHITSCKAQVMAKTFTKDIVAKYTKELDSIVVDVAYLEIDMGSEFAISWSC